MPSLLIGCWLALLGLSTGVVASAGDKKAPSAEQQELGRLLKGLETGDEKTKAALVKLGEKAAAVHVIVALGRMGAAAKDAIPALMEVAIEGPTALRIHARESLKKIKG